jgi:hypothetical protein
MATAINAAVRAFIDGLPLESGHSVIWLGHRGLNADGARALLGKQAPPPAAGDTRQTAEALTGIQLGPGYRETSRVRTRDWHFPPALPRRRVFRKLSLCSASSNSVAAAPLFSRIRPVSSFGPSRVILDQRSSPPELPSEESRYCLRRKVGELE